MQGTTVKIHCECRGMSRKCWITITCLRTSTWIRRLNRTV